MVRTFLIQNAPVEKINLWLNHNAVHLKYGENYRDFNFKKCLAISTEEIDGQLVGVSSVMNRDIWPRDFYRILNRHFILPKHRTGYKRDGVADRTLHIIKQQTKIALKNKAKCVFISIHSYRPRWSRYFADYLTQNTQYEWKSEDLVLITNSPKTKSNYQHIIYSGDTNFFNERKIEWNTYTTLK
jgi:hypothetical protein